MKLLIFDRKNGTFMGFRLVLLSTPTASTLVQAPIIACWVISSSLLIGFSASVVATLLFILKTAASDLF